MDSRFDAGNTGAYHIILYWLPITEDQWGLAGNIIRNTNGLTVLAASTAAFIAWRTNQERAKESVRSDFRDRIHWATQNFTGEPSLTSIAAGKIIDHYTVDKRLSPEDTDLAITLAKQKQRLEEVWWRKYKILRAELEQKAEIFRNTRKNLDLIEDVSAVTRTKL